MSGLANSFRKFEKKFDKCVLQLSMHHPYLFIMAIFIGTPLFVLCSVCICTVIIVLPISLIMGWV
ncbi:MAG: hypothetical protein PUE13_08490 [Clostridiales bacterium]|nr:hypothetical protein [Clostridiales bacterium]